MKSKTSTYIAIISLLVAVFSVTFGVYSWNRGNKVYVSEKRILLLQKIIDLQLLYSTAFGNFSVLIAQVERIPTPTHVRTKKGCIPAPELYNFSKETKEYSLEKFNKWKDIAKKRAKEANELYLKYSNYDVEFTREQIEKEITNVDYKIGLAKVLSK